MSTVIMESFGYGGGTPRAPPDGRGAIDVFASHALGQRLRAVPPIMNIDCYVKDKGMLPGRRRVDRRRVRRRARLGSGPRDGTR